MGGLRARGLMELRERGPVLAGAVRRKGVERDGRLVWGPRGLAGPRRPMMSRYVPVYGWSYGERDSGNILLASVPLKWRVGLE